MTRVLITGFRDFTDYGLARDALNAAVQMIGAVDEVTVVHGAAKGADTVLAGVASGLGFQVEPHPAQWSVHEGCWCHDLSRRCGFAGPRRNAYMLSLGADLCLGFPLHPEHLPRGADRKNTSRGTWDMLNRAAAAGVPTFYVWIDDNGGRVLRRHETRNS